MKKNLTKVKLTTKKFNLSKTLIQKDWYLYILENNLGLRYVGITTQPDIRLTQHQNGLSKKSRSLGAPESFKRIYLKLIGSCLYAHKLERYIAKNSKLLMTFETFGKHLFETHWRKACDLKEIKAERKLRRVLYESVP